MDDVSSLISCLSGCLTILCRLNVINEQEALDIIETKGYAGLFDFLNEKYELVTIQ